jgi:hypothetical protein
MPVDADADGVFQAWDLDGSNKFPRVDEAPNTSVRSDENAAARGNRNDRRELFSRVNARV